MPASTQEQLQEILDVATTAQETQKAHASSLKTLDGQIAKILDEQKSRGAETVEIKQSFQDQTEKVAKLEDELDDLAKKLTNFRSANDGAEKSIGSIFAESDVAKNYNGGTSRSVSIDIKDVTSAAASAGSLIRPQWLGLVEEPMQPHELRNLLSTLSVTSNAVDWAKELLYTSNADYQVNEGDPKPQSEITYEPMTVNLHQLAHWMACSKQVLADVNGLQQRINTKLLWGLLDKEEQELLMGNGNNSILGLLPQATDYDPAPEADITAANGVDRLALAATQVSKAFYPATGYVMGHDDWDKILLTKTDDNAYLFANPVNGNVPRLWGRRVARTFYMPAGTFMTGAFGLAATVLERDMVDLRIAEQHGDFFIRNMVAILAEKRVGLAVERPAAIIKGDLA